jgi:hypothetical protein
MPDNVSGLRFKLRIVAGHVALQTVWLQTGLAPDAMDGIFADVQGRGKLAANPVSRILLRPPLGEALHHPYAKYQRRRRYGSPAGRKKDSSMPIGGCKDSYLCARGAAGIFCRAWRAGG